MKILLFISCFVFAGNVDLRGRFKVYGHYKDESFKAPEKDPSGYGRMKFFGEKSLDYGLKSQIAIEFQGEIESSEVSGREVVFGLGKNNWKIYLGKMYLRNFAPLSSSRNNTTLEPKSFVLPILAQHSKLTYAKAYEVNHITGTEGKSLAFHYDREDSLLEFSFYEGSSDGSGSIPNTQDFGMRPHWTQKNGNLTLKIAAEYLTKKENEIGTRSGVQLKDKYEWTDQGYGIYGLYQWDNFKFGASIALTSGEGTDISGASLADVEKKTLHGRVKYQRNPKTFYTLAIVWTKGEAKATSTSSEIDDEQMSSVLAYKHKIGDGTSVGLSLSYSIGEREVLGKSTDYTQGLGRIQLVQNFK